MRHVTKPAAFCPPHLLPATVAAALDRVLVGHPNTTASDRLYRGDYPTPIGGRPSTGSRTREALNTLYHSKCAYCETECTAEIEHYRPKSEVAEDKSHPGYYWLCYEWTNLIPSCHNCNTAGAKGTQFPVLGARVPAAPFSSPGMLDKAKSEAAGAYLLAERPALLHPEVDEPRQFLGFTANAQGKGFDTAGIDPDGRGDATIRICRLNREDLTLSRDHNVVFPTVQAINADFQKLAQGLLSAADLGKALHIVFDQLTANAADEHLNHTLLRGFMVETSANFAAIVAPRLPDDNQRQLVLAAFATYKARP